MPQGQSERAETHNISVGATLPSTGGIGLPEVLSSIQLQNLC
ncbi:MULTISPECIES: hypothetical protein [unclassified Moorena]|nr:MULTISPECIES: hypothetical protein [unclassified Moorena]